MDDGKRTIRRRHDLERRREPSFHRADQHLEIRIARQVRAHILVENHQDIVAGDTHDVGGHGDAGRAVLTARARHIADGRVLYLALHGDVHLAVGPRQALDEQATHADQIIE